MFYDVAAIRKNTLPFVVVQLLFGCEAEVEKEKITINRDGLTEMTVPQILRTVSAIDPDQLILTPTVNNVVQDMVHDTAEDVWRGVVQVPANQHADVEIEWGLQYADNTGTEEILELASQRNRFVFVGSEARAVEFFADDYDVSFDTDRDGLNNLAEIAQQRSPTNRLDVFIDENGTFATFGDGLGPSGICGNKIPITVVTRKPAEADTPIIHNPSWWCAKLKSELIDADGNVVSVRNLEVTVNVYDDEPVLDSGTNEFFVDYQDDSVEIYIDGNNTKGLNFDGFDDYQFMFSPYGNGVSRLARGPGTLPENLNSTYSLTDDGYQVVAVIPLQAVNIIGGRAFGFTVEVNDDDDGGLRDYKYSWVGSENEDFSFFKPAVFGTAQVP